MPNSEDREPFVVKKSDKSLTEAQKAVLERHLVQMKLEKNAALNQADAEKSAAEENNTKKEHQRHLGLYIDMKNRVKTENVSGMTTPAALLGDLLQFAAVWGDIFRYNVNKEFPSVGKFRLVVNQLKTAAFRWVGDKLSEIGPDEAIALAGMTYSAQLESDGKLTVDPISLESDRLEPDMHEPDQQKHVKFVLRKMINDMTVSWLSEKHGYTLNTSDNCFYTSSGQQLDKAKFKELRDHDLNGLNKFLEDQLKLRLRLEEKPDPTASGP